MLQLGFVSAILPDVSFAQVIALAAEYDYHCVEVMCWPPGKAERRYAGVTHIDVHDLSPDKVQDIHQVLRAHNVTISALGYYPNPMEADESRAGFFREHLRAVIAGAAKLGISRVNTFVGRVVGWNEEDNLRRFAELWPPIVAYAAEHGVRIGIENCPMYFTYDEWPKGQNLAYSPAIWRRMFEIIPDSHFGLNYDPSHPLWMQMDYLRPIYDFRDRLHHLHIKDARVYPEKLNEHGILANPLTYHSPKLPGLGDINWAAYFSALHDIRYRGPVVVEVEDKAFEDSLEARKLALRTCREYLRQWIP